MNNFEEKQRIKTAYTYISKLLGNENFDWNTQVKVSDVYNILQEAMKDVAVAQRYADAIFAACKYYQTNHPDNSFVKKFRDEMLDNPLVGNVDNDSKIE